ncbi:MAG: hypothetical protein AUJ07_11385 [Crenarchaeota archaeon 13_1_40CM_3_53_5]|nr:MAG: hypothetical protein AUJ07_11385 [Crenarchaeota archaeon 13_1_40CM_3_53_5]
MSFEVVEERVNPLMGRRETKLIVHHEGAGTPDRLTVRKLASDHFKAPMERVFVRSIATRTGGSSAVCAVEVYDDRETADLVLPFYLKNRNLPKNERVSKSKKQEEPKAAPPAKPSAPGKPAAQAKTHVAEKPAPPAKPPSQKHESSATKESKAPITPDSAPKP